MPLNLNAELKLHGCGLDPDAFRDLVVELQHAICPDWTPDELLCHPTDAVVFCQTVRRRAESPGLPEHVICRTLLNLRKHEIKT
jgi:hypothetical protein